MSGGVVVVVVTSRLRSKWLFGRGSTTFAPTDHPRGFGLGVPDGGIDVALEALLEPAGHLRLRIRIGTWPAGPAPKRRAS